MPCESNVSYISKVFKSYFYCSYVLDTLSSDTFYFFLDSKNMGEGEGFLFGLEVWGFVSRSPLLLAPKSLAESVFFLV